MPYGYGLAQLRGRRPPDLPTDTQLEPDYTQPEELRRRAIAEQPPKKKPFSDRHPFAAGFLAGLGGPESSRQFLDARGDRLNRERLQEATGLQETRLAAQNQDERAIELGDPNLASSPGLRDAIARHQAILEGANVPGYTNVAGKLIANRPEADDTETLAPGASLVERKTGKIRATAPAKPTEDKDAEDTRKRIDQLRKRGSDLAEHEARIRRDIAKLQDETGDIGGKDEELRALQQSLREVQEERRGLVEQPGGFRATMPPSYRPPGGQRPAAAPQVAPGEITPEEARAIADVESRMNEDERRRWAGFTDEEKLYILKELQGAQ